jgi:hypothetical protein
MSAKMPLYMLPLRRSTPSIVFELRLLVPSFKTPPALLGEGAREVLRPS